MSRINGSTKCTFHRQRCQCVNWSVARKGCRERRKTWRFLMARLRRSIPLHAALILKPDRQVWRYRQAGAIAVRRPLRKETRSARSHYAANWFGYASTQRSRHIESFSVALSSAEGAPYAKRREQSSISSMFQGCLDPRPAVICNFRSYGAGRTLACTESDPAVSRSEDLPNPSSDLLRLRETWLIPSQASEKRSECCVRYERRSGSGGTTSLVSR